MVLRYKRGLSSDGFKLDVDILNHDWVVYQNNYNFKTLMMKTSMSNRGKNATLVMVV